MNSSFYYHSVGAGLKLSICAGLKLTRRLNDVVYYTGNTLQNTMNSFSGFMDMISHLKTKDLNGDQYFLLE